MGFVGREESCFIACAFSVLAPVSPREITDLHSFFGTVVPFSEEEESLYRGSFRSRDGRLLEAWAQLCLKNRKGYAYFDVLPVEVVLKKKLTEYLNGKKWVAGFTFTVGELTRTYSYLLRSLRQLIMVDNEIEDPNRGWKQATITLGPVPWYPYDSSEPMNIATLRATKNGINVVVAAGNEGRLMRGISLNPWALAPWVIGVGATTRDGTELLESSSRGEAGAACAPTVVAPGETTSEFAGLSHGDMVALEHIRNAPPKSSDMAIVGKNVFLYFKDSDGKVLVQMMKDSQPSDPVPLEELIESLKKQNVSKTTEISGTSFAAEYVSAVCSSIARHLKMRLPTWPKINRPKLLKTVLEDMAQPLGSYNKWEIGHGLVTREIAENYLSRLSDTRLSDLSERALHRW